MTAQTTSTLNLQMNRRAFVHMALATGAAIASGGFATGCTSGTSANTLTLKDMAGRSITYEGAERVFCSNPIGTADLYMLAPESLVGWNFLPSPANSAYLDKEYLDLPALGVWMGAGSVPNSEEIAAQDPQLILCFWTADEVGAKMADEIFDQTQIPVAVIDYDVRSTPATFTLLGEILGKAERAKELAEAAEDLLSTIEDIAEKIPANERKSVFLAQGTSGLTTDPEGSLHVTDALELIKTANVAVIPGAEGQGMGMPTVNLEQIASWNPDAVLVAEYSMSDSAVSNTYAEILADKDWRNVPCVAEGEVYRIPQAPFSWFGRPPSCMRLLGCLWLLKVLYPTYSKELDLATHTRNFYRAFLRYDITDEQLEALLSAAGIDPKTGEKNS